MSPSSMQQQVESQLLASYESLYRLAYTYVKNPDDAMEEITEEDEEVTLPKEEDDE